MTHSQLTRHLSTIIINTIYDLATHLHRTPQEVVADLVETAPWNQQKKDCDSEEKG